MRTEVAIYLPVGCIPESRRGFWWEQKRTCPTTPGWIRCRSTTLSEARTEAPVWLIHQAPQRAAPVLPPAELNFTSTPPPPQPAPPAYEMLPGFAAPNIRSGKSKRRGKWTVVQAPAVPGFGVQNYGLGELDVVDIISYLIQPHWFSLAKGVQWDICGFYVWPGGKDVRNVKPTYYFQIQARLFPTFPLFTAIQAAPVFPVLDGFCVSIDLAASHSPMCSEISAHLTCVGLV